MTRRESLDIPRRVSPTLVHYLLSGLLTSNHWGATHWRTTHRSAARAADIAVVRGVVQIGGHRGGDRGGAGATPLSSDGDEDRQRGV